MSVADKLTTIAKNEQKVYDAGYNEGFTDGLNSAPPDYLPYTTICRIPDLNLPGRKEIEFNLPLVTSFKETFYQNVSNTIVEHLTLNGSQDGTITSMQRCFGAAASAIDYTLKRITLNCDFSNCTTFSLMCEQLRSLEVIDGTPIDFSSATASGNIFYYCDSLKEFRVKAQTIKKGLLIAMVETISDETIQSIVDGLADLTGQTQQTIMFGFTPSTKLTDEQKLEMTAKNWNVTLLGQ